MLLLMFLNSLVLNGILSSGSVADVLRMKTHAIWFGDCSAICGYREQVCDARLEDADGAAVTAESGNADEPVELADLFRHGPLDSRGGGHSGAVGEEQRGQCSTGDGDEAERGMRYPASKVGVQRMLQDKPEAAIFQIMIGAMLRRSGGIECTTRARLFNTSYMLTRD